MVELYQCRDCDEEYKEYELPGDERCIGEAGPNRVCGGKLVKTDSNH